MSIQLKLLLHDEKNEYLTEIYTPKNILQSLYQMFYSVNHVTPQVLEQHVQLLLKGSTNVTPRLIATTIFGGHCMSNKFLADINTLYSVEANEFSQWNTD